MGLSNWQLPYLVQIELCYGLMNHYKSSEGIHNNAESKKAYIAEIKFWVLVWLLISCLPVPDLGRIHAKLAK